jgi:hemoglobin
MSREIYVPDMRPGEVTSPSREIYASMGEANIMRMMEDFYRELEQSPIREMFPPDMLAAARKNATFFVQVMGAQRMAHLFFARSANPREIQLSDGALGGLQVLLARVQHVDGEHQPAARGFKGLNTSRAIEIAPNGHSAECRPAPTHMRPRRRTLSRRLTRRDFNRTAC